MKVTIPDSREAAILRRNGIDPGEVGIILSEPDRLVALVYRTRDTLRLDEGDRKWTQKDADPAAQEPASNHNHGKDGYVYYYSTHPQNVKEVHMTTIEKIEAQQKKAPEYSDVWMVGEQLKDICRQEPESEKLIGADLDAITLADAAQKIEDWADAKHKKTKGNCVCVPPQVAEGILRECYGLGAKAEKPEAPVQEAAKQAPPSLALDDFLDINDFL